MKARAEFLGLFVAAAGILGCGTSPLGVAERSGGTIAGGAPSLSSASQGMTRTSIRGTVDNVAVGNPDRLVITPSGRCHFFEVPVYNVLGGDLVGPLTFQENEQATCNLSDVVGSGPFSGPVTWNGRTGMIAGEWTTNCTSDPSQPIGLSCGGVMNARGSGGLGGVQFHFEWGPGWYPFAYTGTAFSQ